jgi:hypothetical protein
MVVDSWKGLKELPVTGGDADAGAFQKFLESMEDKQRQITYLIMVSTEVIEGFDVKTTHPYSFFYYKKTGYKKLFQPNKNIVVNEMKRRDPNAKPNQNNRTNEELLIMLKERWPLREKDNAYIIKKEAEYRKLLLNALSPGEHFSGDSSVSTPSRVHADSSQAGMDVSDLGGLAPLAGVAAAAASAASRKRVRESSHTNNVSTEGLAVVRIDQVSELLEGLGEQISRMAYGNLADTIEKLKKEKFDLLGTKIDQMEGMGNDRKKLLDERIKELSDSIQKYSERLDRETVIAL